MRQPLDQPNTTLSTTGSGVGRYVTDLGTLGGQKGSSSQFQLGTNFGF